MPSSRGSSQPGIESASLMSPALAGRFYTTSATWEAQRNHTPIFFLRHMERNRNGRDPEAPIWS